MDAITCTVTDGRGIAMYDQELRLVMALLPPMFLELRRPPMVRAWLVVWGIRAYWGGAV